VSNYVGVYDDAILCGISFISMSCSIWTICVVEWFLWPLVFVYDFSFCFFPFCWFFRLPSDYTVFFLFMMSDKLCDFCNDEWLITNVLIHISKCIFLPLLQSLTGQLWCPLLYFLCTINFYIFLDSLSM
jgi:hypothetical protein